MSAIIGVLFLVAIVVFGTGILGASYGFPFWLAAICAIGIAVAIIAAAKHDGDRQDADVIRRVLEDECYKWSIKRRTEIRIATHSNDAPSFEELARQYWLLNPQKRKQYDKVCGYVAQDKVREEERIRKIDQ